MSELELVPVSFKAAGAFVIEHHRHHPRPPRGGKFCLGVVDGDGQLHGVVMVGRPVARALDDGRTFEVNRTCTDGTRNANSMLYAAAWRVARAMGCVRVITYTQDGETGASLRAAGYRLVRVLEARGSWLHHTRDTRLRDMRVDGYGGVRRFLWERS